MTSAGMEIVNSILAPTDMSVSVSKRTPHAEMFCVRPLSDTELVLINIGSRRGKRTALRNSEMFPLLNTQATEYPSLWLAQTLLKY